MLCEYWPVSMLTLDGQQTGLTTNMLLNVAPQPPISRRVRGMCRSDAASMSSVRMNTKFGRAHPAWPGAERSSGRLFAPLEPRPPKPSAPGSDDASSNAVTPQTARVVHLVLLPMVFLIAMSFLIGFLFLNIEMRKCGIATPRRRAGEGLEGWHDPIVKHFDMGSAGRDRDDWNKR